LTKILAALLLLLGTSLAAAPQAPPAAEWKKFTSRPGHFSILMPGDPQENKETKQTPFGPSTSYLFTARDRGEIFLVGWVDYDPKFKFDVQKELEANRDNFVKGVKGRLLTTTRASLGTNPGIEFTVENDQAFFRSWVYVVGRRPYQLIAVSPKGATPSPNVARFQSSFAILPAR